MGVIDDTYKQESEDIDNNFMESLENGKKKKFVIKKYLNDIHKSRKKYENRYKRHLILKKWKIWHKLKKIKKKPKYKHLKIKHFDFEFNSIEKLKIVFNIFFFNIKRFFLRTCIIITPKLTIYIYYKITKITRSIYGNIRDDFNKKHKKTKEKLIKFFVKIAIKLKSVYTIIMRKVKKVIKKIKRIICIARRGANKIKKKIMLNKKKTNKEDDIAEEEECEEEEIDDGEDDKPDGGKEKST